MITIDQAFVTENNSVFTYFQRPGVGFYIPLYQREYSWDSDNIEQLLEDISKGIENVIENKESEIRFLGTVITVAENDKNKIQPQDTKALPAPIEKIIDGQQRLASISLFSSLLFKHILTQENKIEKSIKRLQLSNDERNDLQQEIKEICKFWKDKLIDVFSVDLKRGKPTRKPKIIRGSMDKWVIQEEQNTSYLSPVAKYLFQFIKHFVENGDYPTFDKNLNAGKNLTIINNWIEKSVVNAHVNHNGFVPAGTIIKKMDQENIWSYDRPNLQSYIEDPSASDNQSFSFHLNSLVQIFAVCHYLLDRCCFTIIQPINDDWAFDMFQSLNATGTPLTAIETFKPLVVNTTTLRHPIFKSTVENSYFAKIEQSFGDLKSAAQKSKFTNDLLTSFAIPTDGTKLASHFSSQRKWLEKVYDKTLIHYDDKREFIKYFGNYAEFYSKIWNNYSAENSLPIPSIMSSNEAELASLLVLYLRESNHKMAITLIGSYYHEVLEGKQDSVRNFISAVKALAAFYTLWRSAKSNSGLDDAYRTFFRGSSKQNIAPHTWIADHGFEINSLKTYLVNTLKLDGLNDRSTWLKKAIVSLRYDTSTTICKFALFVAAHDTIPDPQLQGIMKTGTPNCSPYLKLEKWISSDLKTIEHIAPEKKSQTWDESLYDVAQLYQSIGNLTLLPSNVNTSASNKGWKEKYLYYQHLGVDDPDIIQKLATRARINGIDLSQSTVELLRKSSHASHIKHILEYGETSIWNSNIVNKRANKILEILWDKISDWIF